MDANLQVLIDTCNVWERVINDLWSKCYERLIGCTVNVNMYA